MKDAQWRTLLKVCRETLGVGDWDAYLSESWCAFTTFGSLENGARYWNCGFPQASDLLPDRTLDGGVWRQSFSYQDLAHLIVPASFCWEHLVDGQFRLGHKAQNLALLASNLEAQGIPFRQTDLVIEWKLY